MKQASVTRVPSYFDPSLISINGATSGLANPGNSSGLNVSRSRN